MKMTYQKSQFEMPDGKYAAKFLGVTMREATGMTDPKGNVLPPPMTWDFEITEAGEHKGKKADRMTGRQPTPKSACGKFLAAITDSVLRDGVEVDLQPFYGKLYRITVQENRVSDNPAPVLIHDGQSASVSPKAGPPSRPPSAAPAPANAPAGRYWVDLGGGAMNDAPLESEAVAHLLLSKGLNETAMVCQDGTETWKPARDFGIVLPL